MCQKVSAFARYALLYIPGYFFHDFSPETNFFIKNIGNVTHIILYFLKTWYKYTKNDGTENI